MKILMVLTSHSALGNTGKKTGFWLEEFAAPYYVFKDAGADITLASPAGGQPPLDPKSDEPDAQTEATQRFKADQEAQQALANTHILAEVQPDQFDAVFYPGGHGPLWDLSNDQNSLNILQYFDQAQKPMALVCHAPAVLKNLTSNGQSFVKGKKVTGFSNSEEDAVGLTEVVPFLIEDEFKAQGALYEKGPDWQSFVLVEGQLITGQNPGSSEEAAVKLLELLKLEKA